MVPEPMLLGSWACQEETLTVEMPYLGWMPYGGRSQCDSCLRSIVPTPSFWRRLLFLRAHHHPLKCKSSPRPHPRTCSLCPLLMVSCSWHDKWTHTWWLKTMHLFSYSSGGQTFKASITGLRSQCLSRPHFLWGLRGNPFFTPSRFWWLPQSLASDSNLCLCDVLPSLLCVKSPSTASQKDAHDCT